MKLLFDQNISFRIVKRISIKFPESKQVRELGLENVSDKRIWSYAKNENYTIVTFDSDFYNLSALYGHPPKVIWLKTGNISTNNIANTLEKNFVLIEAFLTDNNYKEIACIEIF